MGAPGAWLSGTNLSKVILERQLDPSETDIWTIQGIGDDGPVAKIICLPHGGSGFGQQDRSKLSVHNVNQIPVFHSR